MIFNNKWIFNYNKINKIIMSLKIKIKKWINFKKIKVIRKLLSNKEILIKGIKVLDHKIKIKILKKFNNHKDYFKK